jgi:hypothetical protein
MESIQDDEDQTPALNRVIRIAGSPGMVRATLEDDFHHFRVILRHDGERVTDVAADSPRAPFSLCPAAGLRLCEIVGTSLTDDMTAIFRVANARDQCTHQFDLAALALAAAARSTVTRRYRAIVHDPRAGHDRHALLRRDGEPVLDWVLDGYAIVSPPPFAGRSLGAGFTAWAARDLDTETAEAALVLRRAVFISAGRGLADDFVSAPPTGGCWVQQPERAPDALRVKGSTRDFTGRVDKLTHSDEGWLASRY